MASDPPQIASIPESLDACRARLKGRPMLPRDLPGTDSLVGVYLTLRARPIALLWGPPGSGKLAAARHLGAWLASAYGGEVHEMVGHSWWASGSGFSALVAEAQQRLNRERLLAIAREAAQRPSSVQVAILSRVSAAEWDILARIGAAYLRGHLRDGLDQGTGEPASLPENLVVIATSDAAAPGPWDPILLRTAGILRWERRGEGAHAASAGPGEGLRPETSCGHVFIRTPGRALRRVRGLPGWKDERIRPLLSLPRTLRTIGLSDTNHAATELLLAVASAWTATGDGLFAAALEENLAAASRWATSLAILPRLVGRSFGLEPRSDSVSAPGTDFARHPPSTTGGHGVGDLGIARLRHEAERP